MSELENENKVLKEQISDLSGKLQAALDKIEILNVKESEQSNENRSSDCAVSNTHGGYFPQTENFTDGGACKLSEILNPKVNPNQFSQPGSCSAKLQDKGSFAYIPAKPHISKFSMEGGSDWVKWLNNFESVMYVTLANMPDAWIYELEKHLEGLILQKFCIIKNMDLDYDQIKTMLTKYIFSFSKYNFKINNFAMMQKTADLSLSEFMIKLEAAYSKEFPDSKNRSIDLFKKFIFSVSEGERRFLSDHIRNVERFSGKGILWDELFDYVVQIESQGQLNPNQQILTNNKAQTYSEILQSIDECKSFSPYEIANDVKNRGNVFSVPCRSCIGHPGVFYLARGNNNRSNGFSDKNSWSSRSSNSSRFSNRSNRSKDRTFKPTKKCYYCKKPGHEIRNCYAKNKACFGCGSHEHFISRCPEKTKNKKSTANFDTIDQSASSLN
jgi:hypothetical protein